MAIVRKKVRYEIFQSILSGKKRVELRLGNLQIQEGDTFILEEQKPGSNEVTGRSVQTMTTYILSTKDHAYWSKEDVDRYGYKIIQFELHSSEAKEEESRSRDH